MKYYLFALRPRQWTKNLIVFAAPFFNFEFRSEIWFSAFYAFIIFCMISSSIYLINDSLDIEVDKKHPEKRFRPIASGKVSISTARILSTALFFFSVFFSSQISSLLTLIILLYFFIQISYCLKLKNQPILDIFCIASGFLLRGIAGLVAAFLPISPWFLITIGLSALFLVIEKRKAELRLAIDKNLFTRKVLKRYSLPLLLRLESCVSTSSFVTYSLWASGPTLGGAKSPWMMITIPFVLLGIFRYQFISDPEEANRLKVRKPLINCEKPEEILLSDLGIKITILGWILTTLIIGLLT